MEPPQREQNLSGLSVRREFHAGMESARIRSYKSALLRALQIGCGLAAAWLSPVAWWGRIMIFLGVMFLIGVVVQYREIHHIDQSR